MLFEFAIAHDCYITYARIWPLCQLGERSTELVCVVIALNVANLPGREASSRQQQMCFSVGIRLVIG